MAHFSPTSGSHRAIAAWACAVRAGCAAGAFTDVGGLSAAGHIYDTT